MKHSRDRPVKIVTLKPNQYAKKGKEYEKWLKKENILNVFIVREIGVPIGVGTVTEKELM